MREWWGGSVLCGSRRGVPWKVTGDAVPGGVLGTRWGETAACAGEAGPALSLDALELHVTAAVPALRRGAAGSRGEIPLLPVLCPFLLGAWPCPSAALKPIPLPQLCAWEQTQGLAWGTGSAGEVVGMLLGLRWLLAAPHHGGRAAAVTADRVQTPGLISNAVLTGPWRCECHQGGAKQLQWPHSTPMGPCRNLSSSAMQQSFPPCALLALWCFHPPLCSQPFPFPAVIQC